MDKTPEQIAAGRTARTLLIFEGYIAELQRPVTKARHAEIEADVIACHDLMNYSAEVVDLNSPPMRRLDWLLSETSKGLHSAILQQENTNG